jgi:phage I-like protein
MKLIRVEGKVLRIAATDGVVPEWVQLWEKGWIETTKYPPSLCDDESMRLVMKDHEDRGVDIVIDYEHQTETGQKAPAAGWIKELESRDDGLWARVEWTAIAADHISKKEYRYFSPVYFVRQSDQRIVSLESVALTNYPATKKQKPLVNKGGKGNEMDFFKMVLKALGLAEDTDETKVIQVLKAAKDTAGKVAGILGLKHDAGPEEIETSVRALKAKADSPPPASPQVLSFLGLSADAKEPEVLVQLQTLKAGAPETAQVKAELETVKQKLAKRDTDELTAKALAEGKISAAQEDWFRGYAAKDFEGATAYVAKATPTVPVTPLPKTKESDSDPAVLTDEQKQINKQLGITDEAWKKYGPGADQAA